MPGWDSKKDIDIAQTHAAPSVVDDHLAADVKDRAPSHAAVSKALATKQERIISTDDIKEGKEHLWFTGARAIDAVAIPIHEWIEAGLRLKQDNISSTDQIPEGNKNQYFKAERAVAAVLDVIEDKVMKGVECKQNVIHSTDDISEGDNNHYFTDQRARSAVISNELVDGSNLAPTCHSVTYALRGKQDVISSSDDISEGVNHKYLSFESVKAIMQDEIDSLRLSAGALADQIKTLKEEVEALKPKWTDQFKGGTGEIDVLVEVSSRGAIKQKLRFRAGQLASIDSPILGPLESR